MSFGTFTLLTIISKHIIQIYFDNKIIKELKSILKLFLTFKMVFRLHYKIVTLITYTPPSIKTLTILLINLVTCRY